MKPVCICLGLFALLLAGAGQAAESAPPPDLPGLLAGCSYSVEVQ
jgi:hypothetical protein